MLAGDVPWWGKHYIKAISGGGALAATAVHVLDLAIWLAGSPRPLTATASSARIFPRKRGAGAPSAEAREAFDVEDMLFGHVRFEGGFWLTLEGSWVWDEPGWNYSLDLVGDAGQARMDPLRLAAERDGAPVDVTGTRSGGMDFPPSVARELADVVAAIREGREPLVRAREALVVQSITDALYRSAELGREVDVVRARARRLVSRPLEGRVAVVIAGARGIGAATTRALAGAGARVAVLDVDAEAGEELVAQLARDGLEIEFRQGDAADERAVDAIVEDAWQREGRLDIVHANAGIGASALAVDLDLASWRRVVDVNLTGCFLAARAGLRRMRSGPGGAIVFTSSPHALATTPASSPYAATKAGILGLTRALAIEGAAHGVRVNAVLPGAVDTPMVQDFIAARPTPPGCGGGSSRSIR